MTTINRKVSGRELRRQLDAEAQVARAALHNEQVTRARLDGMDQAVQAFASLAVRGLWGRLRWLVTGR